jgi:hypothetical protein
MHAINVTKEQFAKLLVHELPKEVISTECNLYVLNEDITYDKQKQLFKRFYIDEGDYFGNKLLTINTLIDNEKVINIDQLILPKKIVVVNKKVVGFVMRYIENNTNLGTFLNSNMPIEKKKKYLKEIGAILRKVQNVEKYSNNFYLTDVNENNFIINKDDRRLYAIDMDSCKIGDNQPFISRYLSTNINLRELPTKYPINDRQVHVPSVNTEWLCYVSILLNYIGQAPMQKLSIDNYYRYLEHLNRLSFPKEVLDCFSRIYENDDNYSPEGIIDLIPRNIERANFKEFRKKMTA